MGVVLSAPPPEGTLGTNNYTDMFRRILQLYENVKNFHFGMKSQFLVDRMTKTHKTHILILFPSTYSNSDQNRQESENRVKGIFGGMGWFVIDI